VLPPKAGAGPAPLTRMSEPHDVDQARGDPVVVPHRELSAELLRSVVESFVLREGTDYGEKEIALEQKVARVIGQLERGEVRIIFEPDTETVDIVMTLRRP
jgi:uncharacterized protein YheU (UPF0270 family)